MGIFRKNNKPVDIDVEYIEDGIAAAQRAAYVLGMYHMSIIIRLYKRALWIEDGHIMCMMSESGPETAVGEIVLEGSQLYVKLYSASMQEQYIAILSNSN
jgi:hypothetical protein